MRKVITYFDGPETLVGKKPRAPLSIREQSSRRQLSTLFGPPTFLGNGQSVPEDQLFAPEPRALATFQ